MENDFKNFEYSNLNRFQVGKFGEYWVKMWLSLARFDTYTTEIDDKGIDFIIRLNNDKHLDIQVKTIRKKGYIYIPKHIWKYSLRENLILALVILNDNEIPQLFLIPSTVWNNPNELFCDRDYLKENQKSLPEWGINISNRNLNLLEEFSVSNMMEKLHKL